MNTDARLRSGTVPVPKLWCEHGLSADSETVLAITGLLSRTLLAIEISCQTTLTHDKQPRADYMRLYVAITGIIKISTATQGNCLSAELLFLQVLYLIPNNFK